MISSKESAKASSAPATSAVLHVGEGDVAEGLPGVGPEVGRGLLERGRDAAQARDHVVVDDDDAEGGVRGDDREQAEVDAEHLGEGGVQRHAGDDPGQRDRQDHEERDRLAAEEAEARDGERGERAEQDRDPGGAAAPPSAKSSSASRAPWLSIAFPNHSSVKPGGGHSSSRRLVEGVDHDDRQRDVDEGQRHADAGAERPAGSPESLTPRSASYVLERSQPPRDQQVDDHHHDRHQARRRRPAAGCWRCRRCCRRRCR